MIRLAHLLPAALLLLALPGLARAQDALDIINKSDRLTKAETEVTHYKMTLIDGGEIVSTRELTRYYKRQPDGDATVLRFTDPASVRGVGVLIKDHGAVVNDMWLYTPATEKLRRIAGAQKQNWFMGTEFSYEDFEDYKVKFFRFTLVKTAPCGKWPRCYVIDATPTAPEEIEDSGYSRKRYWIEAKSYYPVMVELYDKQGKLWKRQTVEDLTAVGRYARPTAYAMANLTNNRSTRLVMIDGKTDRSLDDYYLTTRYLRSSP